MLRTYSLIQRQETCSPLMPIDFRILWHCYLSQWLFSFCLWHLYIKLFIYNNKSIFGIFYSSSNIKAKSESRSYLISSQFSPFLFLFLLFLRRQRVHYTFHYNFRPQASNFYFYFYFWLGFFFFFLFPDPLDCKVPH